MKSYKLIILLLLIIVPLVIFCQSCQNNQSNQNKGKDNHLAEKKENVCTTEDEVLDMVLAVPEVQALSKSIEKETNGKHGISDMVYNQDSIKYYIRVGYDGELRFETYFLFYVNKKTCEITVEEQASAREFPLKEWQERYKWYQNGNKNAFGDYDGNDIIEVLKNEKTCSLPFNDLDLADWDFKYNNGEIEDDGRYPCYTMDSNLNFKSLYMEKWATDTIPRGYYTFNTYLKNCKVFLVNCHIENKYIEMERLVTYNMQTGNLDGITMHSSEDKQPTSFTISKDLKVSYYENTFNKEDSLINQKLIATYQIQDDGKIVRVANSQ